MSDWRLIQSYWQHFYKYQSWQPNLYWQILQELEEEKENFNKNEEEMEEEKITRKGGE